MSKFQTDYRFDPETCRHYLNDHCTVLHCHHFMTLYTQLADDAVHFEGERLFKEAAEDTFYYLLQNYFTKHNITQLSDQVQVAEDYWKTVGMGIIQFTEIGKFTVRAEMLTSHIDQGWLEKWGADNKPINFITSGFIAAVAALVNQYPIKSYSVKEVFSLIKGDHKSVFHASLK